MLNPISPVPKQQQQQDDKRNRLRQRKQGMFRRADSMNCLLPSSPPEAKQGSRGYRRSSSLDTSASQAPLLSQRWASEQKPEQAPSQPTSPSQEMDTRCSSDDPQERPKLCRWDSDKSLDKAPKTLSRPPSHPSRAPTLNSPPVRTRSSS